MAGNKLFIVFLILSLSFSVGFSEVGTQCANCDAVDCTTQSNPPSVCSDSGTGGCKKITKSEGFEICDLPTYAVECNSTNLFKPSNHVDFGSNSFVYDTNHPYFCINGPSTTSYVWKTCYSGSATWVNGSLLCDGVNDAVIPCGSTTCTDTSTVYSLTQGDYVCHNSVWTKTSDLTDTCKPACDSTKGRSGYWDSTNKCCEAGDYWAFTNGTSEVCYDGGITSCDESSNACTNSNTCTDINTGDDGIYYFGTAPNGNCCGDDANEFYKSSRCAVGVTCDGGSTACASSSNSCVWSSTAYPSLTCLSGLFCNSGTWINNPDTSEAACTCIKGDGYWGGTTNKCCTTGDHFNFNSTASCNDGSIVFCNSDTDLCKSDGAGKVCLKTGSTYFWADPDSQLCTSDIACKDNGVGANPRYTNIGKCSSLNGWYGGGNTPGCGDDPSAEERRYSCVLGSCTYSSSQTLDCDNLDGWYGGGNTAGCGDDPPIVKKDSYVSTSTWSCATPVICAGTSDDSCDTSGGTDNTGDICSNTCVDANTQSGGVDYFWPEVSAAASVPASCDSQTTSQTVCSSINTLEALDGGKNYYVPGYVDEYTTCSQQVGACITQRHTDSCSNGKLTEYWVNSSDPTNYVTESNIDCDTLDNKCATASSVTNMKYFKDYSCTTNSSGGFCGFTVVDFDTTTKEICEGQDYCGLIWIDLTTDDSPTKCCGDDANEYPKVSGTSYACCDQSTDCNYNGECLDDKTFQTTSHKNYCYQNVTRSAKSAALCDQWVTDSGYYAMDVGTDNAKWASALEAKAICQYACLEAGEVWNDNSLVSGASKCCFYGSENSMTQGTTYQYLCNGNNWLSSQTKGLASTGVSVFENARYLSDGSKWFYCDGTYSQKTVNNINYVCTGNGWQDAACTDDQKVDSLGTTYCEGTCGGTWITSMNTCCGNILGDEYFIGTAPYTQVCDAGLNVCDSNSVCNTSVLASTTYYCYNGAWSTSENFEGSAKKTYNNSIGCCKESQCWGGNACYDIGASKGLEICTSDGWTTCDDSNRCASLSTSAGVYYCSDTGWSLQSSDLCQDGFGICSEGNCMVCGTDYSYGQQVNGYYCTTAGFSRQACVTNADCSSTSCGTGVCANGVCSTQAVACGTQCEGGVCDDSGTCAEVLDVGASCSCDANCLSGLYCSGGVCTEPKDCGDGVCQSGECSACPSDCSIDQCKGDSVCSTQVGESCETSPSDCACSFGYCDTTQSVKDSWGCVAPVCGNNVCEKGECSYCTNDCSPSVCSGNGVCDVALGETCDNSDDCTCGVIFEADTIPTLRVGESSSMRVYVENTGNAPLVIDLDLSSDGLEINGGKQKVYLSPFERKDVLLEIKANKTGEQKINFLAKSSKGTSLTANPVEVKVKEQTPWESILTWFKSTPFYGLYDFAQLIFFIGGPLFAFFKIFLPKKKNNLNPYSRGQRYPGYYYGNGEIYKPKISNNYYKY